LEIISLRMWKFNFHILNFFSTKIIKRNCIIGIEGGGSNGEYNENNYVFRNEKRTE
jgi:hypothetical protein